MHRTNGDSYGTGTSSHSVPGIHLYRDEDPGNYDATQGRHQEQNAIQEEICDVIEHESITLNDDTETPATMTQLREALDNRHRASRLINDSGIYGSYVDDSLNFIKDFIDNLDTDDVANASSLDGTSLSDVLEDLDSDEIWNTSNVEGTMVEDVLNVFYNLRHWYIHGCSHGRNGTYIYKVNFNDGYAIDTTGSVLMRMPRQGGSTFVKNVVNGSGWVAGHDATGIPDGVTVAADTKLAIFLLRLPSGDFDIGFDTDLTAANLRADTDCLATHYRRIGFCMVHSMDSSNGQLYRFSQDGDGNHKTFADAVLGAYPYYEKALSATPSYYGADIYVPMSGILCDLIYQVALPDGTADMIIYPFGMSSTETAHWQTWNQWHASTTSAYWSNFLKFYFDQGSLVVESSSVSSVSARFHILGWKDRLSNEFPGS